MHKFKIILLAAQLGLGALDAHSTRHVITHGGYEMNPLGRPFVHSPALYATNAAGSLGAYWLSKKLGHKHPKLSLIPQAIDAGGHASGWLVTRRVP